jgi:endonuclease/exonuclease/phosphatase family metal-dependent hydrolase
MSLFRGILLGALGVSVAAIPAGALPQPPETTHPAASARAGVQVLQMNLCNTGTEKGCYAGGQSIAEAVALINSVDPTVVTVNEICERDLTTLASALGGIANALFEPVWNTRTSSVVRCANGDASGDAVLVSSDHPVQAVTSGRYSSESNPAQARVYACVHAGPPGATFYACVTHLALNSATALSQCRQLLGTIVPGFKAKVGVDAPAVVAGDFNLRDPAQGCLPSRAFSRTSDGAVQNVVAEEPLAPESSEVLPMRHTDHPALVVRLAEAATAIPTTNPAPHGTVTLAL